MNTLPQTIVVSAIVALISISASALIQSPAPIPGSKHWAFMPPILPNVPKVKNTAWIRTPVDAFVLARLEAKGLKPPALADTRILLRRLYLDLIGLPPSP